MLPEEQHEPPYLTVRQMRLAPTHTSTISTDMIMTFAMLFPFVYFLPACLQAAHILHVAQLPPQVDLPIFLSLIMEMDDETEEGVPSASDVADATKTEEEDTESELEDDILADELEKDTADDDEDVDLEYDPSDEELVDIASGVDGEKVKESFF